eukprot:TRINITY_DN38170_c0_g2_i1.p1 TRINITY_DN38170_c0_g2~~TRINITY_DN38170_c0_g2_i1.p1  ORF type:complete len:1020 (+),score=276.25 TRINITY_DN38170_c0_g2_i1:67-3126(+)
MRQDSTGGSPGAAAGGRKPDENSERDELLSALEEAGSSSAAVDLTEDNQSFPRTLAPLTLVPARPPSEEEEEEEGSPAAGSQAGSSSGSRGCEAAAATTSSLAALEANVSELQSQEPEASLQHHVFQIDHGLRRVLEETQTRMRAMQESLLEDLKDLVESSFSDAMAAQQQEARRMLEEQLRILHSILNAGEDAARSSNGNKSEAAPAPSPCGGGGAAAATPATSRSDGNAAAMASHPRKPSQACRGHTYPYLPSPQRAQQRHSTASGRSASSAASPEIKEAHEHYPQRYNTGARKSCFRDLTGRVGHMMLAGETRRVLHANQARVVLIDEGQEQPRTRSESPAGRAKRFSILGRQSIMGRFAQPHPAKHHASGRHAQRARGSGLARPWFATVPDVEVLDGQETAAQRAETSKHEAAGQDGRRTTNGSLSSLSTPPKVSSGRSSNAAVVLPGSVGSSASCPTGGAAGYLSSSPPEEPLAGKEARQVSKNKDSLLTGCTTEAAPQGAHRVQDNFSDISHELTSPSSKDQLPTTELGGSETPPRAAERRHEPLSFNHAVSEVSMVLPRSARWQIRAAKLTRSMEFDLFIMLAIAMNTIMIGMQLDFMMRNMPFSPDKEPRLFGILERVFSIVFTWEIAMRLFANRWHFFKPKETQEMCRNYFDLLIVSAQLVEHLSVLAWGSLGLAQGGPDSDSGIGAVRVLRITRLVRTIRVLRLLHFVRPLWTLVISISTSLCSLGWTLILLGAFMYVVGLVLMQLVVDFAPWSEDPSESLPPEQALLQEELILYWGSLSAAMTSLLQAILGGIDWRDLSTSLYRIHPLLALPFFAYVTFGLLALLNVITGVFVESAVQSAAQDKEKNSLKILQSLFHDMDDGDGKITIEEFTTQCHNPMWQHKFKSLDIDLSEVQALFVLLDIDRSGSIEVDEFVHGCMQLRGLAKAANLAQVLYFLKALGLQLEDSLEELQQMLCNIDDRVASLETAKSSSLKLSPPGRQSSEGAGGRVTQKGTTKERVANRRVLLS